MELAFDMPAVRKWADFSGDYNPIHFDLAHARIAGLDALIVHGMLALMPIKQALACSFSANDARQDTTWVKFRANFRTPIAHDSANILDLLWNKSAINFRLSHIGTGAERFRGAYGSVDTAIVQAIGTPIRNGSPIDNAQLMRFAETYPEISESWIALDAAVFSDFMCTKLDAISRIVEKELGKVVGATVAGKRVVVQTGHTVFANTAALSNRLLQAQDWGAVMYDMRPPVLIAGSGQVNGSVSLPVYRNGQLVMLVEIGLLAKASSE